MDACLIQRCRGFIGAVLRDWPRYARALRRPGPAYLAVCNRAERLTAAPLGLGFKCEWQWTSELVAPKYLPRLGSALMRRSLRDHPIGRARAPASSGKPRVSFLIGHRGIERLPHLLATLESIAAQRDAAIECVVVEQDNEPLVGSKLPAWVRYVHTPLPRADLPYCRAWAFNVAVRHARADTLVLHDNDMLVPQDYARGILDLLERGFEVINAKRFVFYLTERHTRAAFEQRETLQDAPPLAIVQNLEGGGSVGITRSAYEAIGGFDEAFLGWGGEDVEFWERAATRRVWSYGWLPIVHLWHPPQPGKHNADSDTLRLYHQRALTPPLERAQRLRDSAQQAAPA